MLINKYNICTFAYITSKKIKKSLFNHTALRGLFLMLGDFVKKITRHLQDTFMLFEGVFDQLIRIVFLLYSDSIRIRQVKYLNKFKGLLPKSLVLLRLKYWG